MARRQVLHGLRNIQPHEYVALYWLGNGLRILHDFIADAFVLQQLLAGFESKSSRQILASFVWYQGPSSCALRRSNSNMGSLYVPVPAHRFSSRASRMPFTR
jgi:hypothetical protein